MKRLATTLALLALVGTTACSSTPGTDPKTGGTTMTTAQDTSTTERPAGCAPEQLPPALRDRFFGADGSIAVYAFPAKTVYDPDNLDELALDRPVDEQPRAGLTGPAARRRPGRAGPGSRHGSPPARPEPRQPLVIRPDMISDTGWSEVSMLRRASTRDVRSSSTSETIRDGIP